MSVGPTPGERFGPYDIVAPLGAGGMGVVFRARDSRLGREVALKTLPAEGLSDPVKLQRFEQEARAASALNHPNVLVVFDVGREGDTPFLVTELLEGKTLRERLREGPLGARKVIELAAQIAQGLAAVHEKGIVHRDLKPDNVFLTREGHVKILDFGVARTTEGASTGTLPLTASGAVIGTAGYMSPEQVRGRPADARSDLFALGAILHECLTGRMAFPGETPVERGYAILNSDPEELDPTALGAPVALVKLVRRCLEKSPEQRFQHARDVAFALEVAGETAATPPSARSSWSLGRVVAFVTAAVTAIAITGILSGNDETVKVAAPPAPPDAPLEVTSRRVTYRSGTISSARFTADGRGLAYTGAFEGAPPRVYAGVLDGPELRTVTGPATLLFDLSSKDELVLGTKPEDYLTKEGMLLMRASLAGGAARPLVEGVLFADFGADDSLLLVRYQDLAFRLEYPPGKELLRSPAQLANAQLSPDLKYIAFERHPVRGDDRGVVEIIDLSGKTVTTSKTAWTLDGLAWSPSGQEVWFSAGYESVSRQLYALALDGKERRVYGGPGSLRLMDVDRSGRVLAAAGIMRSRLFGKVNGDPKERGLSWLDGSMPLDLSNDGKVMLFLEGFGPAGSEVQTWLRRFDGADDTPVLLGVGWGRALSPDKRWAIISPTPPFNTLRLVPTGAGNQRDLPTPPLRAITNVRYFADGQRIAFSAFDESNRPHLYVQSVVDAASETGAAPQPSLVTETPLVMVAPPSADGKWLVGMGKDRHGVLVEVATGVVKPLVDLAVGDVPVQWTADGKGLWLLRRTQPDQVVSVTLLRYELATRKTAKVGTFEPPDPVGMNQLKELLITPDGKHSAYTVNQQLDELFLLEGVR